MARLLKTFPFSQIELFTAKEMLKEWQTDDCYPVVFHNANGLLSVHLAGTTRDNFNKIKVEKIVVPGFLIGKGRFIAYFLDDVSRDGHNFVIAKNQRMLWPELRSIAQGASEGILDGQTALRTAARL